MAIPIQAPRINNNDDFVRLSQILLPPGTLVRKGDAIAEVETDKAVFTVEAEHDGYLLAFVPPIGAMLPIGSVLAWLGASPDEPVPSPDVVNTGAAGTTGPTLKATLLLARFGLNAAQIPVTGERLTAQDVMAFQESRRVGPSRTRSDSETVERSHPVAPGQLTDLPVAERAMLKTILWHRDMAVPGYVEIEYDTLAWETYAKTFQAEHNLLLSPLLPLIAWRLARLAAEQPALNCTISGDQRFQYSTVNLGFTMQSEANLALLCVKDAASRGARDFVDQLTILMRRAMANRLTPEDTSAATVTFSSMSRWSVTRHIPVLPPYTSLIVAHAATLKGSAALGATYDHRMLTGGEVAGVLHALSKPPQT